MRGRHVLFRVTRWRRQGVRAGTTVEAEKRVYTRVRHLTLETVDHVLTLVIHDLLDAFYRLNLDDRPSTAM